MKPQAKSVSIKADDEYKLAFALYAKRIGKSMAELVRESLDALHGEGIERERRLFFASDVHNSEQSNRKMSDA